MNCAPPDVCRSDDRETHLIHDIEEPKDGTCFEQAHYFSRRDQPLIGAIIALVLLMNIQTGRYLLYPFTIFSTWVHEMCHGLAAVFVRGGIESLHIYEDGSGLAYTWTSGEDWKQAFVASAGYTGTALVGGFLLLFRRTRLGPTVGIIGIGCGSILSCILVVRNTFGVVALSLIGVVLVLCGWILGARWVGYLYIFLSATCSVNALTSIKELFQPGMGYVGGKPRYSDAHTVAELLGMTYWFWAFCWLIFAIIMTLLALIFAFDEKPQNVVDRGTAPPLAAENRYSLHNEPRVAATTNSQQPIWVDQQKVNRLVEMGYPPETVRHALQKYNNNEELALNELLMVY